MARAAVGAARIEMSINSATFEKSMERAEKAVNRFGRSLKNIERNFISTGRSFQRTGRSMMRSITMPLAGAGAGILALQKRTGDFADHIMDLSQVTGMSTRALQEWRNVARVAGVDADFVSNVIAGLSRRMRGISEESGKAFQAAEQLGISFKDSQGNIRDTDEVMMEAIQRLSTMEAGLERAALANDLFGRRWEQLAPVIGLGSEEIRRARQEAHDMGLVMSGQALNNANRFRQEMELMGERVKAIGRNFAVDLMPVVRNEVLPVFEQAVQSAGKLARQFGQLDQASQRMVLRAGALAAAIGPVIWASGKLLSGFGKLIRFVRTAFLVVFSKAAVVVVAVAAAIGGLVIAGQNLVDNWEVHAANWDHTWKGIVLAVRTSVNYIARAMNTVGLISDEALARTSEAAAQARFEFLLAEQRFEEAKKKIVSFGDSARNVAGHVRDLYERIKEGAMAFLGFGQTVDTVSRNFGEGIGGRSLSDAFHIEPRAIQRVEESGKTMKDFIDMTKDKAVELGDALQSTISGAITNFAETLGDAFTGDAGASGFFSNILNVAADFAGQLGRIMIGIGTASLALQTALTNPFAAIAAGAALVALSTAARNLIKKGPSVPELATGGLVFGQTLAVVGDNPNAHRDPEVVAPLSKLEGMLGGVGGGGVVENRIYLDGREVFRNQNRIREGRNR